MSISSFPIKNKKYFSENVNEISTVRKSEFKNHLFRKTSRSYGMPFRFIVSKSKILSQQAQIIYILRIGLAFDMNTKHIFTFFRANTFKKLLKLPELWLNMAMKKVHRIKPQVTIGYLTTLHSISKAINKKNNLFASLKGLICPEKI